MSQTAIPLEFERYLQNQISVGNAPDMNEMIFAHIPGLDPSQPINRGNGLPDVSLWVHQQDIDQVGKLGDNALAYSVVIPGTVAEFTFNAIYLRDKNVPNSCGMVVHKAEETKENGMASTKSLVQAYDGAAQIAGITVDASTWQIDYQARLKGIEEDHRLACLDNYGHTAYVDGFDVTQQADPNKYKVTPGVVYVGGLRGVLTQEVIQTVATKHNGLYVDVVRQGTALSVWENKVTIAVSETELTDYVDGNGDQHYVAKLAGINADGSVVDWRVKGGLDEHVADSDPHGQYAKKSLVDKLATVKTQEVFAVGFIDNAAYQAYHPIPGAVLTVEESGKYLLSAASRCWERVRNGDWAFWSMSVFVNGVQHSELKAFGCNILHTASNKDTTANVTHPVDLNSGDVLQIHIFIYGTNGSLSFNYGDNKNGGACMSLVRLGA